MSHKRRVKRFLYARESYLIRGACYEVWDVLRGVYKESAVAAALSKELELRGLKVEVQKRIPLTYKGAHIGTYMPDFIVDEKILIELKAKPYIT